MNDLQEDTLSAVVSDGIRFLESMTIHYGTEKGMAMWESMSETMGREVKGKVFFAMLTGITSSRVRFKTPANVSINAVSVIKLIRNYTGFGLKEAKDLYDDSKNREVSLDIRHGDRREFVRSLRDLGVIVK